MVLPVTRAVKKEEKNTCNSIHYSFKYLNIIFSAEKEQEAL